MGEMVPFGKRRDAGVGYQAWSQRAGPGVLIVPEFFGLTPHFKALADRLNADELFTALAFDIYDGAIATNFEEAAALRDALDPNRTMAQLKAAAEHLTANWHPRIGVVGFSLGAALASELAQSADSEATVLYYGLSDVDPLRWNGPVLGHFGADDDRPPLPEAAKAFDALVGAGHDAEYYVYEGAGHAFANPDRPDHFDESCAELAYERTRAFLRHHLA